MLRSLLLTFAALAALAPAGLRADVSTYETIDDLGFSPSAESAQQLTGYLSSDDPQQRWRAARALGNLGHKPAAAPIAELLSDEDPVVQVHAMIALTRIGDTSPEVVDAIMAKVGSSDERVARTALQTLKQLKPGPEKLAAALEKALQSEQQSVMVHALEALVDAGGAATPLLKKALANDKSAYLAALAISEIGAPCAETSGELTKLLLRSKDPLVQQQAMLALAAIGDPAQNAAPVVQKLAAETEIDSQRIAACYTLAMLGDESSTELLRRLSGEGGEFQQMVATWSIAVLHPNDPDAQQAALKKLAEGLKSDRPEVHDAAAVGLNKLNAPTEDVAAAMLAALQGASDTQKSNIAAGLANLGADKVLDRATTALGNPQFADVAIEVIGRLGPDAAPAVDALAAKLKDANPDQATRIRFALGAIGAAAASASGEIAAGLVEDSQAARHSALYALRETGGAAARDQLAAFMKSTSDEFDKLAAAWALAGMQPSGEQLAAVAEVLKQGLKSQDPQLQIDTIDAIGRLGVAGTPLKAQLQAIASSDDHSDVRQAAADVLGQM